MQVVGAQYRPVLRPPFPTSPSIPNLNSSERFFWNSKWTFYFLKGAKEEGVAKIYQQLS